MMKATLLRRLCALLLAGLCATSSAASLGIVPSAGSHVVYLPIIRGTLSSPTEDVVALVNQERAKAGCRPLRVSPQLSASAQAHSQDMALNNFVSHTGSNGSSPWDRMEAAGYTAGVAENVAAGFATADAVMTAFMHSGHHRAHILDCSFSEIGVGFYNQPDDQPNVLLDNGKTSGPFHDYWTQDFGAP